MKKKYPLIARRDTVSKWFYMGNGRYSIRLCGDTRKDGFWISIYAKKLGLNTFMEDLTKILHAMEKDKKAPFTLYIAPKIIGKSDTPSRQNQQS